MSRLNWIHVFFLCRLGSDNIQCVADSVLYSGSVGGFGFRVKWYWVVVVVNLIVLGVLLSVWDVLEMRNGAQAVFTLIILAVTVYATFYVLGWMIGCGG
ncbi:hypothetical protein TRIP_B350094 [uncultured Desulfatiglans sp.]|uniref:Uncharacterized protein n=1 Tax=Uncultured Desulfatiglans sp. TaxID=1748965 RepID=A0A653AAC4_UNCDX|nr:hypothetical protein TRIP_B350094 [uncultured Desulfatiglans sp.]